MKYDEAMKTKEAEGWKVSVKEEWERFGKYNVFQPVKREDFPDDAKFVSTTWAMKKKSNGTLRARLNMRGYEQNIVFITIANQLRHQLLPMLQYELY